jgi:hypothetical protein
VEFKRAAYWTNDTRNRHVAAVATALAGDDAHTLKAMGLGKAERRLAREAARHGVAVLVELPEHARRLVPLLPGWSLRDAIGQGNCSDMREGVPRVVVTAVAAHRDGIDAGVVIHASGTTWAPHVGELRVREDEGGDVLMIDFDDTPRHAGDRSAGPERRNRRRQRQKCFWDPRAPRRPR